MSSNRTSADRDAARIESLIGGEDGRLAELGVDVEAVEITPAGKRRVLRVAIDKDGGITLDDVATATKIIDAEIEATDVMGEQPYTLEVTSRGVDRPLTLARHWRRNEGRMVKATLEDGRTLVGRIAASDDARVTLRVDGVEQVLDRAEITKALVQIEFNRKDDH
ncbi:ribosome maturation factor RimP [Nocardioides sambongensis]|uniref:ribosome maturation factor RimP n=1 Tax=Nocardioides sambongensis TaxID=2589074 RepID=UPI001127E7C6|nr:ribosome maturation factor RimP [Nocardioides sambongensis]